MPETAGCLRAHEVDASQGRAELSNLPRLKVVALRHVRIWRIAREVNRVDLRTQRLELRSHHACPRASQRHQHCQPNRFRCHRSLTLIEALRARAQRMTLMG